MYGQMPPQQTVIVQAPVDTSSHFAIGCLLTWCCTGICGIICYACFPSQHFIAGYLIGLGVQFVTAGVIFLVVQGVANTYEYCLKQVIQNPYVSCAYMTDSGHTIFRAVGAVLLVLGIILIALGFWRKSTIAPAVVMVVGGYQGQNQVVVNNSYQAPQGYPQQQQQGYPQEQQQGYPQKA